MLIYRNGKRYRLDAGTVSTVFHLNPCSASESTTRRKTEKKRKSTGRK